jgi:hypothetical protein
LREEEVWQKDHEVDLKDPTSGAEVNIALSHLLADEGAWNRETILIISTSLHFCFWRYIRVGKITTLCTLQFVTLCRNRQQSWIPARWYCRSVLCTCSIHDRASRRTNRGTIRLPTTHSWNFELSRQNVYASSL